jgi:hypothetical protein
LSNFAKPFPEKEMALYLIPQKMNRLILSVAFLLLAGFAFAQSDIVINYDESKVPNFTVPDPLTCNDGKKITTIKQWENQRRPEILEFFSAQIYGRTPKEKIKATYETLSENPNFLSGKATSKQVKFTFTNGSKKHEAILLLVLPNQPKGKAPVFVTYNYKGNHSTCLDPDIEYSPLFSLLTAPDDPDWKRGTQSSRWCYDKIIDRGYGIATMFYQDIYPDSPGKEELGVVSLFPGYNPDAKKPDQWQALGAWAWGSSRIVDYLATQKGIDMNKIIVMGHSRQGKAALWAGAQDKRFKIVISNDSGCGGVALSKRVFGENIARITSAFPHWFCPAFNQYARNEASLPFDQHELVALMAPRKVYIASAEDDAWADPKGEFLGGYYAGPVYELYGLKGLGTNVQPPLHQPVMNDVGYHIRAGVHDVTDYDWISFMDFADKHFGKPKQ